MTCDIGNKQLCISSVRQCKCLGKTGTCDLKPSEKVQNNLQGTAVFFVGRGWRCTPDDTEAEPDKEAGSD